MSSGDDITTLWLPGSHMRERATIPATTRASLDAVAGFMRTRYREQMEDGRFVAELYPEDFQRVRDGYGCPNAHCLAYFNRRFESCPLCGQQLADPSEIVDYSPDHWQPYEGRTSEEILAESRGPA